MQKQVLLVGSGNYGSLIQEAASGLDISLTVIDGREVDFTSFEGEFVIIATPNFTHFNLVRQALVAGKHVLCEKPLALTVDEVKELYKQANEANRYLGVGFVLPNHDFYLEVREKQQEFGPIQTIRVYNHATEGELKSDWYWNNEQSGGWFMIAEIHWYHLLFWLTSSQSFSITEAIEKKYNDRTVATWSVLKTDKAQELQLEHRLDMNQENHWTKVEVVYENGEQIVLDDWVPRTMILQRQKKANEENIMEWLGSGRLLTYQNLVQKNIERLLEAKPVDLPKEIELAHQAAEQAQKVAG